jgi:hypothetical protein
MSLTQFRGWKWVDSKGMLANTYTSVAAPEAPALCQNCGQRPATENWTSEGGSIAFVHGFYQRWCKVCCLQKQLERAHEMTAHIPELEKQLEEELAK